MFIMLMIGIVLTHGVYLRGESDSNLWWGEKVQELVGNEESATEDASQTDSSSDATEGEAVLIDEDLKVVLKEDGHTFEVWNFGNKIGEIEKEHSAVSLFKRDNGYAYLGVEPVGLGGYILFGGPSEVYRADESSLTKVYDGSGKNGFASDVSQDKLVAIEDSSMEGGRPSVVVYDLATQKSQSYPVSSRYGVAGEAYFTQSDDKVTYEAAIGNPDSEEYALYMIDLATGKQTQVGDAKSLN